MTRPPPLFSHQKQTLKLYKRSPVRFDASDPGTAKTRSALVGWDRYSSKRMLVVAVKSNVEAVWAHEVHKWLPGATVGTALAPHRRPAFDSHSDVVVINTDGVKWLVENAPGRLLRDFDTVVVDESSYFKHRTSQRSKALHKLRPYFDYAACLSGTPNSQSVLDLWSQYYFLDPGLLGVNFYQYRHIVADKVQVGPRPEMVTWVDKAGAIEDVYDLVRDVTIRHRFEDCLDIPPMSVYSVPYKLTPAAYKAYEKLRDECIIRFRDRTITGVNAAVLRAKLLQLLSGAAYDSQGRATLIDTGRYDLIDTLVRERDHSIVFFNWRHQREQLMDRLAKGKGALEQSYATPAGRGRIRSKTLAVGYIDGTVSQRRRAALIKEFQDGKLRCLLLHPKTAAHGLTLTRGTACIWASPIDEPDILRQGTHRIHRAGQTKRTECILVEAENTIERRVYNKLHQKDTRMGNFLELLEQE